jgi:hypothetical protein
MLIEIISYIYILTLNLLVINFVYDKFVKQTRIKCKNCKHLKYWIDKEFKIEDNIFQCLCSRHQNIDIDYCSKFEEEIYENIRKNI